MPSDILDFLSVQDPSNKVVLGPGLRRETESIVASKSGVLRHRQPNIYWLETHQKRYVPTRNDDVMGLVTSKAGDFFKVDIGASEQASLSYLAFEGATKRNRPRVVVGDVVYARLAVADYYMEPELVCVDSLGKSKGLGVLPEGFMFSVSLECARKLRTPEWENALYQRLGEYAPFEIAVGMNGRVWLKSKSTQQTVRMSNVILLLEDASLTDVGAICDRIMQDVMC